MPVKEEMTYVASRKGWMKKYRGQMYAVSCKQLGCHPGREASRLAANAWWEAKQAEIDAKEAASKPAPDPLRDTLLKSVEGYNVDDLDRIILQAEAAKRLKAILATEGEREGFNPQEALNDVRAGLRVAPGTVDAVLGTGENRAEKVALLGDLLTGGQPREHTAPDRTIKGQVEPWLKVLQGSVASGSISPGRYDAYARHIGIFSKWIGGESAIDLLTAPKLEEFWAYLTVQIAERKYSPAYAKTIFMTARQFIARLAELGLIPLPGNLRSRRFKFNDGPKAIPTFTREEVKALLKGCNGFSERTKLYLLLMLNCGMYQNDISELGRDEVDWTAGTIKRPRSKTPDGPVVTYKLWPETFRLLKKYKAKVDVLNEREHPRALLTERNRPLVGYWMEGGKMRRYDIIQSAWTRLLARVQVDKSLKVFRKTSSTMLGEHERYKFYSIYFLAQSPKTVADRSYVKPSDAEFFLALEWLGQQYGQQ